MCILSKNNRQLLINEQKISTELDVDIYKNDIDFILISKENVCSGLSPWITKDTIQSKQSYDECYSKLLKLIASSNAAGTVVKRTKQINQVPHFGVINHIFSQDVLTIVPYGYPILYFNQQNMNEILKFFKVDPNFITHYSSVESGRVKIKLAFEMTAESVNNILQELAFVPACSNSEISLISLPKEQPTACIDLSCIVSEKINDYLFLKSIRTQFGTNASKWTYNNISWISKNAWKLEFSTDPLSYVALLANNRKLNINGSLVDVQDEFNPFYKDTIEFVKQEFIGFGS
ncbi:hypothetical protein ACKWTF_015779 [Chironomus riparius]